jgi:hypothetical protein
MSGFEVVIGVVVGIGVIAAVALLATSGTTWKEYGRSHLSFDRDAAEGESDSTTDERHREQEIRELLTARNELRRRRGKPTVDIERELQRVTVPAIDPALRDEIRELVIARNHRRARTGKPPLDVEAEVERKINELST